MSKKEITLSKQMVVIILITVKSIFKELHVQSSWHRNFDSATKYV